MALELAGTCCLALENGRLLEMNRGSELHDALLTLNIGSTSIKFAVFRLQEGPQRWVTGHFDARDHLLCWNTEPSTDAQREAQQLKIDPTPAESLHSRVLLAVFELLKAYPIRIRGIVHRVVHGGGVFHAPTTIDQQTVEQLEAFSSWAPLHQPASLAAIRFIKSRFPEVAQVACFDTAFHHTIPTKSTQFAIPRWLSRQGLRRYGFHGLSFQSVVRQLRVRDTDLASGRLVVAHLGGGSSLCAIHRGESVATTMGLTPLDGLPMATRCGTIDPGLILHLLQREQMTAEQISQLLYRESGLKGISESSGDMRTLIASDRPESMEAVQVFVHRVAREIGAMMVDLQGLDGLVFTGGIGENSAIIRERLCRELHFARIELNLSENIRGNGCISAESSPVRVWCLHTDEDGEMAHQAYPFFAGEKTEGIN